MVLKGLFCAFLAFLVTNVAALDLVPSKWIWTDNGFMTVNPQVVRDFRREFNSPASKIATGAQVIISADNNYTLYVNSELIGQGNNWEVSQKYYVTLKPDHNVFAVAVENQGTIPGPAAWIAAFQINYADGTSDIVRTDAGWLGNNSTAGFQNTQFDDSSWPNAVVAGGSNTPPWHVPYGPYDSSSTSIGDALWVWTDEVPQNSPTSSAPIGNRAFRKTINIPGGAVVSSGVITIDADNEYTLYINGKQIGTGNNWPTAQRFKFTLDYPTNDIVIAVEATNNEGEAGIIASIGFDVADCSCSTTLFYATDGTWKFSTSVPAGFEQPNFGDSTWKNVVVEGPYGVPPWGNVTTLDALGGGSSSGTGSLSSVTSTVGRTTTSTTPPGSSSSSNTGHSGSSTPHSTITIVAVVGSIVILVLLASLIYFYRKAKINKASQPGLLPRSSVREMVPTAQATLTRPMVLPTYDPQDPSTFPPPLYRGAPELQTTHV